MKEFDLEERVAKAKRLFKEEGYNCCQAVVLAYNDVFDMDDSLAASLSSGFGGGMGRLREVCGSVSGMVMLAGLISPAADPSAKDGRTRNYSLVQEVAGEFKAINGSIAQTVGAGGVKTLIVWHTYHTSTGASHRIYFEMDRSIITDILYSHTR